MSCRRASNVDVARCEPAIGAPRAMRRAQRNVCVRPRQSVALGCASVGNNAFDCCERKFNVHFKEREKKTTLFLLSLTLSGPQHNVKLQLHRNMYSRRCNAATSSASNRMATDRSSSSIASKTFATRSPSASSAPASRSA